MSSAKTLTFQPTALSGVFHVIDRLLMGRVMKNNTERSEVFIFMMRSVFIFMTQSKRQSV